MKRKIFMIATGIILTAGISVSTVIFRLSHDISESEVKTSEIRHIQNLTGKKVTVLTNQPHIRSAEAIAKWFQNETGAVVQNIVANYEDALNRTLKDVSSADPQLDVIMLWYADLGALVENNAIVDLTDFIEKNRSIIQPDDFIPSIYRPYTLYKERRWAIPYDGDTHVLFYRKSVLEKYNLKPPRTWDEYLKIGKIITEKERENGFYGMAIMAPDNPMIIISSFMNRLGGYGGRLSDENGNPIINSKEAVAALSAMVEHSHYALPSPLETDWEVSRDAFLSGRVAMVEQWTDIGVMAEDPNQSVIQGDWDVVQMPMGSGEKAAHSPALNAGFSLAVSSKSPDTEAAFAYLLFASRPDISLKLNLINGGIDPVRISVITSEKYRAFAPEISKAAKAALTQATPWIILPQTPQLLEILTSNIILTLEGKKSPQQALEDTQSQWVKILEN